MKSFNVLIYNPNLNSFEPYDIMPHLLFTKKKYGIEGDIKEWVIKELKYQYWARCEYEFILKDWPCGETEKKIDIYEQCMMNIDIIVDLFKENLGISV